MDPNPRKFDKPAHDRIETDEIVFVEDRIVDEADRNPDPITGAPGSHPVGTGVGAASAGLAGAAIGSVAGPIGTAVGAVVGAVTGGLVGKGVAESINPTAEEEYWRANFESRPYIEPGTPYDVYAPAYRHGWQGIENWQQYEHWEEVEPELRREWENRPVDTESIDWDAAKHAVRDSWERLKQRVRAASTSEDEAVSGNTDYRRTPK